MLVRPLKSMVSRTHSQSCLADRLYTPEWIQHILKLQSYLTAGAMSGYFHGKILVSTLVPIGAPARVYQSISLATKPTEWHSSLWSYEQIERIMICKQGVLAAGLSLKGRHIPGFGSR